MLSRVAENLYWLARYVERAEAAARLVDEAFQAELDALETEGGLRPLESVLLVQGCLKEFQTRHGPDASREQLLEFLTFDKDSTGSIRAMVALGRENARGTQETLSTDAWSQLNQLHLYLSSTRARRRLASSPTRLFDRVQRECLLFSALVDTTMLRDEAHAFILAGRFLERANMLARALAVMASGGGGLARWTMLLRSVGAYVPYQRYRQETIDPAGVANFLLLEVEFPRTLRFCVGRCLEALRAAAGGQSGYASEAERQLGRLDSDLRYLDTEELFRRGFPAFLDGVRQSCARIDHEIQQAYFLT